MVNQYRCNAMDEMTQCQLILLGCHRQSAGRKHVIQQQVKLEVKLGDGIIAGCYPTYPGANTLAMSGAIPNLFTGLPAADNTA